MSGVHRQIGGGDRCHFETLALQCDTICPGGALPKFYATCLSSRADESTCWPIRSDFHNTITHLHHPAAFSFVEVWNDQLVTSVAARPGQVLVALCDFNTNCCQEVTDGRFSSGKKNKTKTLVEPVGPLTFVA